MRRLSDEEKIKYGLDQTFITELYDVSEEEKENTVSTCDGNRTFISIPYGNAVITGKVSNDIVIVDGGTAEILFTDIEFIGEGRITNELYCDKVIFGNINTNLSTTDNHFNIKCRELEVKEDSSSTNCFINVKIRKSFRDIDRFSFNLKDISKDRSICDFVSVLNKIKDKSNERIEKVAENSKQKVLKRLNNTRIGNL